MRQHNILRIAESAARAVPLALLLIAYLIFAAALFSYSHLAKSFSQDTWIRDLILLDAWGVFFLVVVVALWFSRFGWRKKSVAYILSFSVYGFVVVCLLFDGTPFSYNAYWGDQQFRLAMILRFVTEPIPNDFYYKNLPPFYPPVYYYLLSLYSRIFSVETFKMLKVGSMFIYLMGPALLYYLWRKLVTPFQAVCITLATFLFCSQRVFPLTVPHAFLSNTLFVPWWLYYVEQVRKPVTSRRFYLAGGIIGAVIFMTYFYPFFIGGFVLLLRLTSFLGWSAFKRGVHFRTKVALGVLFTSALMSLPYWLPLLVSIDVHGIDRSRGGWHHMGTVGLNFGFMDFTMVGLTFLGGLYYSLRRKVSPIHRSLVLLVAGSVVYLLVGSLLGYFDRPINLIKAREFVAMTAGVFVGLALAGLIRSGFWSRRRKNLAPMLAVVLVLILVHGFHANGRGDAIKSARTTRVPLDLIGGSAARSMTNRVVLSGSNGIFSFYPCYSFLSGNEHYAHPASRHFQRYNLLYLLHQLSDPYLFNLGLRHNVFDIVDYYFPVRKGENLETFTNLSNYPDKLLAKTFRLNSEVVSDTGLFQPVGPGSLYRVLKVTDYGSSEIGQLKGGSKPDSRLLFLAKALQMRIYLTETGRQLMDQYLGIDTSEWHPIDARNHVFADSIVLRPSFVTSDQDSTYFLFCFQPKHDIGGDYKVFFHLWDDNRNRYNLDFRPAPKTDTWKKADIYFCLRAAPKITGGFHFSLGFFTGQFRLGLTYRGVREGTQSMIPGEGLP